MKRICIFINNDQLAQAILKLRSHLMNPSFQLDYSKLPIKLCELACNRTGTTTWGLISKDLFATRPDDSMHNLKSSVSKHLGFYKKAEYLGYKLHLIPRSDISSVEQEIAKSIVHGVLHDNFDLCGIVTQSWNDKASLEFARAKGKNLFIAGIGMIHPLCHDLIVKGIIPQDEQILIDDYLKELEYKPSPAIMASQVHPLESLRLVRTSDEAIFFTKIKQPTQGRYVDAYSKSHQNGKMTVLKGSIAAREETSGFEHTICYWHRKLRKSLQDEGILTPDQESGGLVFTRDYTFPSSTYAASVVWGRYAPGNNTWIEVTRDLAA